MDDHDIERRGLRRAGLDHALELGPAVVRRGRARLDIGLDELVAARLRNRLRPAASGRGSRRRARPAAPSRRAGRGRRAAARSWQAVSLRSSARPEQFVEEVAEPCLEHVDLGVRDRHALGPIVRDASRSRRHAWAAGQGAATGRARRKDRRGNTPKLARSRRDIPPASRRDSRKRTAHVYAGIRHVSPSRQVARRERSRSL